MINTTNNNIAIIKYKIYKQIIKLIHKIKIQWMKIKLLTKK